MERFYYMRQDANPVHGLQDWSEQVWQKWLATYPDRAANVAVMEDEDTESLELLETVSCRQRSLAGGATLLSPGSEHA